MNKYYISFDGQIWCEVNPSGSSWDLAPYRRIIYPNGKIYIEKLIIEAD